MAQTGLRGGRWLGPPRSGRITLALILGWAALAPLASAQTPLNESIPLERMRLATDRSGLLSLEGGGVTEHLAWDVGLWLGWSDDPLVVYRLSDDQRMGSLVGTRVGGSLVGSVGLWGWGQLGFELPAVFFQQRRLEPGVALGEVPPLSSGGVGSVRLVPKVGLLNSREHGLDLALIAAFTVPTGRGSGYIGDSGFEFQPELALSRSFGTFRLAANLGAALRRSRPLLNINVGSELTGQIGAGFRLARPLELGLALGGNVSARQPFAQRNETALELRGMLAYDVSGPVQLFVGGGRGLSRGWGAPDWRAFGGIRVTRMGEPPMLAEAPRDTDGDGLTDDADRCPAEPETNNGHEDADGCPDQADQDGDGIADASDACPQKAEDRDEFEDTDGCPDPDDDRDGLADAQDGCPRQAGPLENKGCPDKDRDGDTLVDRLDPCPGEAGPVENNGCPDKDRDGDSLVDRLDECPDLAGPASLKGCPKTGSVKLAGSRIEFKGVILFATNRDIIQKRSFPLLDNVAAVIRAHPEIRKIRVEGHTDNVGKRERNQSLSERRAQAVVRYLVAAGVSPDLLVAQGFGDTRPVANNKTRAGRAQNRRVEFHVVSDDSGEAPPDGGAATKPQN